MTKKAMNFRLSELARKRLADKMDQWNLNATEVLERLLTEEDIPRHCIQWTSDDHREALTKVAETHMASPTKLVQKVAQPPWKTKAEGET